MTATDDRTAGKWPARADDPTDVPTDLYERAQERTQPGPQRRGVWSRLRLHGRTEHATTLPSVPGDQPREDATQYAAAVHAGSQHPALRAGKGVETVDDRLADNIVTLDALRGTGSCERCSGTNRVARVKFARIPTPMFLCSDCRPRAAFGVIDGGGAA